MPSAVWTVVSDGLKGLFQPDPEWLNSRLGTFKTKMEEKFAVVFQVRDAWGAAVQAFNDTAEGDWSGVSEEVSIYGVGGTYSVGVSPTYVNAVGYKIRFWVTGAWQVLMLGYVIKKISHIIRI